MRGTKVVLFLFVCLVPLWLFAWGTGHDQVNELAVEMLHGVVPAESAANIVKWSHTPDDFTPWEKLKQLRVPQDDLDLLKAHKLDSPCSCHSPKGQAVTFILLVNAFRDNESPRIPVAMKSARTWSRFGRPGFSSASSRTWTTSSMPSSKSTKTGTS